MNVDINTRLFVNEKNIPRASFLAYVRKVKTVTAETASKHFNITRSLASFRLRMLAKEGALTIRKTRSPNNPCTKINVYTRAR